MKSQTQKGSRLAIRSAGRISILNGFGFFSAFLIDVVIAGQFGLSKDTDALFIALTIPQLVASIFLVAVSVALVPIFTRVLIEESKPRLWDATSNLMNIATLVFLLFGIIGSLISPIIVAILGAGLSIETRELAIELNGILFLMIIPIGAIEVIKATLNALHSFAFPAATALIKNIVILLIILFAPSLNIRIVAIGYVISTFIQFIFLILSLRLKGFRYQFTLGVHDDLTHEALRQLRHPLAGAFMGQGNVVIERFLASFLPLGVISALGYARRILRAVDNIFLGSVTTAFLPRLSAQSANSENKKYKSTLITSIKMLAFISLPITALIMGMSESIIRLLFERGAFSGDDTRTIALLLNLYVISIPAWAVFQALQTSYYSTGDTKRPFQFRIITLVFNIALDLLLFYWLGAPGLALALSISRIIITIYTAWILHSLIDILNKPLISFFVQIVLASLLFGVVVFVLHGKFGVLFSMARYATLTDMIGRGLIGAIVFFLSLFVMQVREVTQFVQQLKNRFKIS